MGVVHTTCRTTNTISNSGTMTIDCTSESILSIYLSIDGDRIDDIRITMPFYYQSFIRPLGGSFETPSALPRQHSSCPSIYILCRADKDNIAAFRAMADRARICGCSASLVHDVTRNLWHATCIMTSSQINTLYVETSYAFRIDTSSHSLEYCRQTLGILDLLLYY